MNDAHKKEFAKVVEPGLDAAKHWPLFIESWYVQSAINLHSFEGVEANSEEWSLTCEAYYQDEMAELTHKLQL